MSRARTNKENRPKRPSTLGLLLGGTGGRKDASKGAEAERQRRRRERDRSREMAAYVGYDAMYKDGIAQVMPGMFSQTIEFSDISYQSARKEARETAFTVMSSLFNYFPGGLPRAAPGRERAHPRRRGRPQGLLRARRARHRRARRRVQPHPQRQDARGRLEPRAPPLPDLRRGRRRRRRRGAQARAHTRRRGADARAHTLLVARPRRRREARALAGAAAPGVALRVLLGQIVPDVGRAHEGLRHALHARLQARGQVGLLLQRRALRRGARRAQLRVGHRGDLPRLHHRPAAAAQRDAPRAANRAERGARAREAPDRLDGQGDHRRADERREEGLRLPDPAARAALLEGGGRGAARLPAQQVRAPVRLHGPRLHLGRQPRGARPPRAAGDERRAGLHDRPRAAPLPPAPGAQLGAPARGQPRHREPLPHHGTGGDADALREPEPRRGGRRLLRAVQGEREPGAVRPQAPGEPHGIRVRQARLGQELLG